MNELVGSRVISTKISEHAYEYLVKSVKKTALGTTYNAFQYMFDAWIKAFSIPLPVSGPLIPIRDIVFQRGSDWKNHSSISSEKPDNTLEVGKCICFVHEQGKSVDSRFAVMLDKSYFGNTNATYNAYEMFEYFMKSVFPQQYKALMKIGEDIDSTSSLEVLSYLIDKEESIDNTTKEVEELFNDNDRVGFGQHGLVDSEYERKYKRGYKRDIETVTKRDGERQTVSQTNLFDQMESSTE